MSRFRGQYWHNLDPKNRLFIPSKFREQLGESFILCMPLNGDQCLFAYSEEGWDAFMDEAKEDLQGRELVRFQRLTNARIDSVEADKQGRITIKPNFCEYAGLEREIYILGAERRIEIWSVDNWNAMMEAEGSEVIGLELPY